MACRSQCVMIWALSGGKGVDKGPPRAKKSTGEQIWSRSRSGFKQEVQRAKRQHWHRKQMLAMYMITASNTASTIIRYGGLSSDVATCVHICSRDGSCYVHEWLEPTNVWKKIGKIEISQVWLRNIPLMIGKYRGSLDLLRNYLFWCLMHCHSETEWLQLNKEVKCLYFHTQLWTKQCMLIDSHKCMYFYSQLVWSRAIAHLISYY